jgi:hypothetical protein
VHALRIIEPPVLPDQADTLRQLNALYLMAARHAAQVSPGVACQRFGLPRPFAVWLRSASESQFAEMLTRSHSLFRLTLSPEDGALADLSPQAAAALRSFDAAEGL